MRAGGRGQLPADLAPGGVEHDQAGVGVDAENLQLGNGQAPVERHEDRSEAHTGELQLEHPQVVLGDEHDAIAAGDPPRREVPGHPADHVVELGPIERGAGVDALEGERTRAPGSVVGDPVKCGLVHGPPSSRCRTPNNVR